MGIGKLLPIIVELARRAYAQSSIILISRVRYAAFTDKPRVV